MKRLIWQDYLTEFSGILPRVVARLEPEIPYWPSSPSADYEYTYDKFQSGDAHVWDVWHGRVPFSTYETHHARFVTEFGFQSFPEMRTIEALPNLGIAPGSLPRSCWLTRRTTKAIRSSTTIC